ncbi:hypothetical protein D9M68_937950 [compost metagenome]
MLADGSGGWRGVGGRLGRLVHPLDRCDGLVAGTLCEMLHDLAGGACQFAAVGRNRRQRRADDHARLDGRGAQDGVQ